MRIPVGSCELYAEVFGQGPALLCLHGGFGFDHSYFRPYLDPLAESFQLILLDLHGSGRSDPRSIAQLQMDQIIGDLEVVRNYLQLEQWAVLGHSGGGLLAGLYAGRSPQSVSHLLLVGTFPRYPFEAPGWAQAIADCGDPAIQRGVQMFLDGVTTDGEYREAVLRIAPLFLADPSHAGLAPFERIQYRVIPFLAALENHDTIDAGAALRGYPGPVLVVHGEQDYRVPLREAQRWCDYSTHARLEILPHAGHFPFIEQAARFCDLVYNFLH